jgi:hypothetical protein
MRFLLHFPSCSLSSASNKSVTQRCTSSILLFFRWSYARSFSLKSRSTRQCSVYSLYQLLPTCTPLINFNSFCRTTLWTHSETTNSREKSRVETEERHRGAQGAPMLRGMLLPLLLLCVGMAVGSMTKVTTQCNFVSAQSNRRICCFWSLARNNYTVTPSNH